VLRALIGAATVVALVWLLHRGAIVAPVSLYAAYGSANGFFTAGRVVPVLALIGAAGALWAVVDGRVTLPGPAALLVIALPLGALALAAGHAVYPHDARVHLLLAAAFAIFWFGLTAALGIDAGALLGLALVAGAGDWLAVGGLHQFLVGQPTPVGWTGAFASIIPVRISASLHNPNVLAAALLLSLGAAVGLAVGARHPLPRILGLVALVPPALALPLTFSRAAYVALPLMVVVTALLLPRKLRGSGLLALATLVVPLVAVAVGVHGVLFRVHTISVQGGGDVTSRFFSWLDALHIWLARPLLGAGPGGLEALYARYHTVGDARGTYVLIDVPGSPDNDPLQWLADTGLVGGLALIAAVVLAVVLAWRARRRLPAWAGAAAPLVGAVVAVAAQGLLEVTAFVLPIEGLLAVVFAALASLGAQTRAGPWWWQRPLALGVTVAGLAVAVGLHATWKPQQAFAQGWATMQAGHPAKALPVLERAAQEDPSSERNVAAVGDAAVQVAYADQASHPSQVAPLEATARTDLGRAVQLVPFDASPWAAAGVLLQMENHNVAAACAQQAAVRDTPDSPYQAYHLGTVLLGAGQVASALADRAYAARLFPLQLDVYREYHEQNQPYYASALQREQQGLAAWGGRALPTRPAYPFNTPTCTSALSAAGFPASPYLIAWAGAGASH
jgi:O-antigen ligase/tetratricopeptide (TPR) repeat protein